MQNNSLSVQYSIYQFIFLSYQINWFKNASTHSFPELIKTQILQVVLQDKCKFEWASEWGLHRKAARHPDGSLSATSRVQSLQYKDTFVSWFTMDENMLGTEVRLHHVLFLIFFLQIKMAKRLYLCCCEIPHILASYHLYLMIKCLNFNLSLI